MLWIVGQSNTTALRPRAAAAQRGRVLDAAGHVHDALPRVRGLGCAGRRACTAQHALNAASLLTLARRIAFVYFQLGDSWTDTYSRAAELFFVVAFLTFMSIAAFPAFIEDMKVFIRERLNGYYGVATFTIANTLASMPFILLISLVSAM